MAKLKLAPKPNKESDSNIHRMDAIAEIEQDMREWSGPCGKTDGWSPFSEPQQRPTFDPDAVLDRASRYVVVDAPVPLWRRILRWLRR